MHFAFFGLTQADIRMRILEGRRSRLEERLEGFRAAATRTRERVDSYTLELQRHGLESVEREVRWLNELIASERQSGAQPGGGRRSRREPTTESGGATTVARHRRAIVAARHKIRSNPHGFGTGSHRGRRELRQFPRPGG